MCASLAFLGIKITDQVHFRHQQKVFKEYRETYNMYLRKSQKNNSGGININQETPTLRLLFYIAKVTNLNYFHKNNLKNKKSDTLTKYNLKELLAESVREE